MTFELATSEHEEQLRELLRSSPMPGWIRIAFDHSPNFFHAAWVQGHVNQVIVALEQGRVVGMGCRSIKPLYVNGQEMDFGYLGGLRLHPAVRRTGMLARGYAALKKLHLENPVPAYLTTVIEGNADAQRVLTSRRARLPHYIDQGRYITYAINLNRRRRKREISVQIRNGDAVGIRPILEFLNDAGRYRQFFPALDAADFGSDYLQGLHLSDFRVALQGDKEIVGVAAAWDQSTFKRNIVEGYAVPVRAMRPLINSALHLAGFRPMPRARQSLKSLFISFLCTRNNDAGIMQALLERIYFEHQGGQHHFLLLGLHERDPFGAIIARNFLTFSYVSRLYIACWDDGAEFVKNLDPKRIPHLELAMM